MMLSEKMLTTVVRSILKDRNSEKAKIKEKRETGKHVLLILKDRSDEMTIKRDIKEALLICWEDLITKEHFAVAVCFGNTKKPSQFLEVDGFWDFRNEKLITEASPFIMNKEALLNRVVPTDPVQPKTSEMKDDLPF